jgi:hypothetical protein
MAMAVTAPQQSALLGSSGDTVLLTLADDEVPRATPTRASYG